MTEEICLHELFEARADARPSDPALVHGPQILSYQELEGRANRLARRLRAQGAGPSDRIAIYLRRSERSVLAILAVLKAGAAYVPLDPAYPEERIRHMMADARVKILITERALEAEARRHFAGACVVLDAERENEEIAQYEAVRLSRAETGASPADLCYIVYTSGTTGRPKGIMTEHRQVVAFVRSFNEVCRLQRSDRVYQGFSLGFDGSVEETWMAFSNGAALVIGPPDIDGMGDEIARLMARRGVTVFSTVPTLLGMITEDVPSLRLLVVSGEPCPPDLVRRWARPGRRMLNVYGPTETTVNATAWECVAGAPVTIGRPLRGYEVHILDEDRRPVPAMESGELYIGGVGVARGYLNQPALTAQRFVPSPFAHGAGASRLFRTGDLVRRTPGGELVYLGRLDSQVKVRGYRIELGEIESVLREHPAVRAAAVKVMNRGGLTALAAFVVTAPDRGGALDRGEILDRLRRRLPAYMIPATLDRTDELPRLASGKVDRARLPEPDTPLVGARRSRVTPRTALERGIAGAWEELFQTSPISVEDDFFLDLGGYSLLAMKLVTLLRDRLGVEVSLRAIYEHATVARLSQHIESLAGRGGAGAPPARGAPPPRRTSREAFERVPRWQRLACVGLQGLSIAVLHALTTAPFVAALLLVIGMVVDRVALATGVRAVAAIVVLWRPLMLALSIALKWLIIGRYKPGRHLLWGLSYFRYWLGSRVQALGGAGAFVGTPLMSLYYRLMGAKIGKGCVLDTSICAAYDLVTIGDGTCVGAETHLLGARVEDGALCFGRIEIGSRCFVGIHSAFGLDTRMEDDARLGDLSLLRDGQTIGRGESWRGSPAAPGDLPMPEIRAADAEQRHPIRFGLLYLLLVEVVDVLMLLTIVPGLSILIAALSWGGVGWAIGLAFPIIHVSVISFCLLLAAFKAALGRVEPSTFRVESARYVKKWLIDALMTMSRSAMRGIYTTIYLPPWLRLLGAKIGRRAEISTVSQLAPDLVDIAEESFFADGSIIGGRRLFRGHLQIGVNRIGRRSFVGNSAMLPIGAHLGDRCLLGVLSTPPRDHDTTPDGSEWLGVPSFSLPYRRKVEGFDASVTYAPARRLYAERLLIDWIRIILPPTLATLGLIAFIAFLVWGFRHLPLGGVVALIPIVTLVLTVGVALSVVALKWVVMGRFEPVIKPLWSGYVWWNEVINGAYETVGAPGVAWTMGTPFFSWYLRLLGCKIGKHCYIGTTLFSEFDLVEIGDYAALNAGVVVQNHLFEDRIMKSSRLTIGDECSIGNMAVILYDTVLERGSSVAPLSLVMKGATLPASSRWIGIPASSAEESSLLEDHQP